MMRFDHRRRRFLGLCGGLAACSLAVIRRLLERRDLHERLLVDSVLKRLLTWQDHSFSPAVFHTRRLFAASQA